MTSNHHRAIGIVAGVAIISWAGVSAWVLMHSPTEAERSAIMKTAELFATMAFGYFLGSSVGSKQKTDRLTERDTLDLSGSEQGQ
jgi:hypothetical protein